MSYLPMECPVCGRVRLIPTIIRNAPGYDFVRTIKCEKCGMVWGVGEQEDDTGGITLPSRRGVTP